MLRLLSASIVAVRILFSRIYTYTMSASIQHDLKANKPFPSFPFPLFQNESWCTTFHMEMSLIFKTMKVQEKLYERLSTKTRFETEGKETRNWPIDYLLGKLRYTIYNSIAWFEVRRLPKHKYNKLYLRPGLDVKFHMRRFKYLFESLPIRKCGI